ncbi:MAG: hypothetical protein M1834_003427 [Cirrosporium novae-zelandiae]|nr:MAG: hypothetical protein M1834_003427 [Cirrosporium novae-zelandiae]
MSPPHSRPRTPGRSPPPDEIAQSTQTRLPSVSEGANEKGSHGLHSAHAPRRTSLGFLRRAKSGERLGNHRSSSSGKRSKKESAAREQELLRQREAIPKQPPRIPEFAPPPQLKTFGGEDRPDSIAIISNRTSESAYNQKSPRTPKSSMETALHSISVAAALGGSSGQPATDPYARTESMTHRGRYSYASSAVSTINSPRRVRRRKDPTPFNILVIGTRNSGKTSFLNFLRKALALPKSKRPTRSPEETDCMSAVSPANANFVSHYLETEVEGERIGVTLWDSKGLDKNVVDLQLREMSAFLESKFEDTFNEEMKVVRSPGVRDTHIHCVFLVLDPTRLDANIVAAQATKSNGSSKDKLNGVSPRVVGALDEDLDLQVLRALHGKTTVLPIISKADTITSAHMALLKKTITESLREANFDPLEALSLDDLEAEDVDRLDECDEDSENAKAENAKSGSEDPSKSESASSLSIKRRSSYKHGSSIGSTSDEASYIPLSILSPDMYTPEFVGRKFPWGFADPYNIEHCDFVKLKDAVFQEWRGELREASREVWYERWRTSRLDRSGKAKLR